MRIALHTGHVETSPANISWHLIAEMVQTLVECHPDDTFLLLGPHSMGKTNHLINLEEKVLADRTSIRLVGKWLYGRQVKKALGQWKPDLVVNLDPGWQPPATTKYVAVLYTDWQEKAGLFYNTKRPRKNRLAYLQQASAIATAFGWQQDKLAAVYHQPAEKTISLGAMSAAAFRTFTWAEKEAFKTLFTDNSEYFLYYGPADSDHEMMALLKAFSQFKKRQKSALQLVLVLTEPPGSTRFLEKLETYKYRAEVKVMQQVGLPELSQLVGGAYAILVSGRYEPGWLMLGAMQTGTAIAAENTPTSQEIGGSAALHLEAWKPNPLAEAMMLIYKDETYRNKLVENGSSRKMEYGPIPTAGRLWLAIEKAMLVK